MTSHYQPVSAMQSPAILVAGILLDDPDGPVAFTARNVECIRENLIRPRSALAAGVQQEDLDRAIAEHDRAVNAALAAEAIVKRIALRSAPNR